jgi:hypothetical protein
MLARIEKASTNENYVQAAMHHATLTATPNGRYTGSISGLPSAWVLGDDQAACRTALEDALRHSLHIDLLLGCASDLPSFDGLRPDEQSRYMSE